MARHGNAGTMQKHIASMRRHVTVTVLYQSLSDAQLHTPSRTRMLLSNIPPVVVSYLSLLSPWGDWRPCFKHRDQLTERFSGRTINPLAHRALHVVTVKTEGIWVNLNIGRTTRDDPGCSQNVTSGGLLGHFRRLGYLICSALQARKAVVTLNGCIKAVQHTGCSGLRIANAPSLLNDYLPPNGRSLLEFRFSASAGLVDLNDIVPGSNLRC
ncbi:hypothetical protein EDB83DRAFT_2596570 [Lactarius deliciosus]|nr:hypothetical protein EDB83DRAFT_2596570 [Lactarius deliciosus]